MHNTVPATIICLQYIQPLIIALEGANWLLLGKFYVPRHLAVLHMHVVELNFYS